MSVAGSMVAASLLASATSAAAHGDGTTSSRRPAIWPGRSGEVTKPLAPNTSEIKETNP